MLNHTSWFLSIYYTFPMIPGQMGGSADITNMGTTIDVNARTVLSIRK